MSCPLRVPINTCYSEYSCYERHHHLLYSSPATWLPECYAANTCGHKGGSSEVFSTFKEQPSRRSRRWCFVVPPPPRMDLRATIGSSVVGSGGGMDAASVTGSAPPWPLLTTRHRHRQRTTRKFMWHQIFDILEINYWKLLEMVLLNALKTFWRFSQLLDSRKKILQTFGDALRKRMLFLQDLLQVIDIGSEMKEICSNTSIS